MPAWLTPEMQKWIRGLLITVALSIAAYVQKTAIETTVTNKANEVTTVVSAKAAETQTVVGEKAAETQTVVGEKATEVKKKVQDTEEDVVKSVEEAQPATAEPSADYDGRISALERRVEALSAKHPSNVKIN